MNNNNYLGYVHSFRGFAILNIVAIHAFFVAQWIPANMDIDRTAYLFVINETLFHDSTLYFALISGLLFSSILRARGYGRFYLNKLRYVVAPYIFCSLVFSLQSWNFDCTSTGFEDSGLFRGPENMNAYLGSIWPNALWGEAQFTYWYIPVLLLMFILTPALDRMARARSWAAIPAWLVMLAPLVVSRSGYVCGEPRVTFETLVYFSGAYTAGIYLGHDLQNRMAVLIRHRTALLLVAVVSTLAIAALMFREVERLGGVDIQETLFYVQKMSFAGFVLAWLHALGPRQPRFLNIFANEAFSIYFLHAFFITLLGQLLWNPLRDPGLMPMSIYLMGPVYFAFALAMSLTVVTVLRKICGKYSRLLIGS